MENRLTQARALHLARLVADVRPEWDLQFVLAALRKHGHGQLLTEVTYAVLMAALDPDAETPFAMTNPLYRLPFTLADAEHQRELAAARSREIRDRRNLDEARWLHAHRDPDVMRRGLADANAVLLTLARRRPETTPALSDPPATMGVYGPADGYHDGEGGDHDQPADGAGDPGPASGERADPDDPDRR